MKKLKIIEKITYMKTNCGSSPEGYTGDNLNFEPKKGGLKKISGPPKSPCLSPEHNPPSHMVFEPGTYEYTCPKCGKVTIFTVPLITC